MDSGQSIKIVFDNLRNLLAGISLITLAGAACRYHQDMGMARTVVYSLAGVMIAVTTGLLIGNAILGFRDLWARKQWLLIAGLAGIYAVCVILLMHALPMIAIK